MYEYFDIFLGRMQMCRHAGEFFGVRFKLLAKRLKHVVYLDKDTLITLSKHIFAVAGQPFDRSSDFFEQHIRNPEYGIYPEPER